MMMMNCFYYEKCLENDNYDFDKTTCDGRYKNKQKIFIRKQTE